jgi:hypothetical protein
MLQFKFEVFIIPIKTHLKQVSILQCDSKQIFYIGTYNLSKAEDQLVYIRSNVYGIHSRTSPCYKQV